MNILFTTFPAKGHFHPLAPLAIAFRQAGHDVRLATGADTAEWAAQCGIDSRPVGLTQAEATRLAEERHPGPDWSEHLFTSVWVNSCLPGLIDLARSWRPDLVVHEEEEYAGVLLAAILGVPCVTHSWSSPARPRVGREAALRQMAPIWSRYLPHTSPRTSGAMYLDACPPQMQSADIAEIPDVTTVRPSTFDGPARAPVGWRADLPRPAAYLTLGTVPVFSTPARLAHAAHAIAPLFAEVVMTTGPNPVESMPALPANVRAFAYLPQSMVLPHVDLVVSQGGAGGTVGALMNALPHLAMAQGGQSQATAAAAIEQTGVGLCLDEAHRSAGEIRAAAQLLMQDRRFSERASRICEDLMRLPSPAQQVQLIIDRLELKAGPKS